MTAALLIAALALSAPSPSCSSSEGHPLRKPRLTYKDETSMSFLASTIGSVAQIDAMVDLAAEVFDVQTSALRIEQKNDVVTISKVGAPTVSMETSPTPNLRRVK